MRIIEALGRKLLSQRALLVLFVAVFALGFIDFCLFLLRFRHLLDDYPFTAVVGLEEYALYDVWKASQGLVVYEVPGSLFDAASLFNFLFYVVYGRVAGFASSSLEGVMLYARLFTGFISLCGIVLFVVLQRLLLRELRLSLPLMVALALGTSAWVGSGFTRWLVFAVRPDMGAMLFSLCGLSIMLFHVSRSATAISNKLVLPVLASVAFYIAWSWKQTFVGYFAASVMCLIVWREWRMVLALLLPFTVLVLGTFLLASEQYVFNTIHLAAGSGSLYSLNNALKLVLKCIYPTIFFWGTPVAAGLLLLSRERSRCTKVFFNSPRCFQLIVTAFFITFLVGLVSLTRSGASTPYLLEAYILAVLLTALSIAWFKSEVVREPKDFRSGELLLLCLPLLVVTTAVSFIQLVLPNKLAILDMVSEERFRTRQEVLELVDHLPEPKFIHDRVLALPWYSTKGEFPAIVVEPVTFSSGGEYSHEAAFRTLLNQRYFKAMLILLEPDWETPIPQLVFDAGYVKLECPTCPKSFAEYELYVLPEMREEILTTLASKWPAFRKVRSR